MKQSIHNEKLKNAALNVVKTLQNKGFEAYWAGGCVRDMLMGSQPKDYDIATSALHHEVEKLFKHTRIIGKAFGVVQVILDEEAFEIATFRKESDHKDGRRPEKVIFTSSAEEDAQRRDFTINGIFYDPVTEKIIDFVDGQKDILKRCVRAIGNPADRFSEDYLRLLRAIRFATTLNCSIEKTTFKAIQEIAHHISFISAERIHQELVRILCESDKAGDALQLLYDSGLLAEIMPEAISMIGQEQPAQYHPEGDVWTHTKIMLNEADELDAVLAFSILLHDIGKPATAELDESDPQNPRIRFNNHARVGAKMADTILKRLKVSNDEREEIVHCVDKHMRFMDVPKMKPNTLRKMVGSPYFESEMKLHFLDCSASHGLLDNYNFLKDYKANFKAEPVLPEPLITGEDIMALGIQSGPEVGKWKKVTYDKQLDENINERSLLLNWLKDQVSKEASS